MINKLIEILDGKKILILGFGKEGIASYRLLIKYLDSENISVADKDSDLLSKIDFELDSSCNVSCGPGYLNSINDYDVIIKSPGISHKVLCDFDVRGEITSQTDLFLRVFAKQTIGVTGTKGKSTTSSLIANILSAHYNNVLLVGNIGVPPFDLIHQIKADTKIVFELSSHQLENVSCSPHIAVLLNIYEEHLDHYKDVFAYQSAKFNITRFQREDDYLIANGDDQVINEILDHSEIKSNLLSFSISNLDNQGAFLNKSEKVEFRLKGERSEFEFSRRQYLPGDHNLMNIMAAVIVGKLYKVPDHIINSVVQKFRGLPHRLEYVGKFKGIYFYNDSIATIPEATAHAVKTLKKVDTLILGGVDRGIDYQSLVEFLPTSEIGNLIFYGAAGEQIKNGLIKTGIREDQKVFVIDHFNELPEIIRAYTRKDHICLLSPAASSYDLFKNFEERGDVFKKIAENL